MLSDDLSDKMSDPTQGRNSRRISPECGNAGEFHAAFEFATQDLLSLLLKSRDEIIYY